MRSKRVAWSTLTNSASQALRSSSVVRSSGLADSTCFLQYSMTFARIRLVTLGSGISPSAQSSSIMCLMICDWTATASSTSNDSPSELRRVIFFADDIVDSPIPRWPGGGFVRRLWVGLVSDRDRETLAADFVVRIEREKDTLTPLSSASPEKKKPALFFFFSKNAPSLSLSRVSPFAS
ncbi:hypothetical protein EUGRSUZ_J02475 [Eucalyptus grandis]|uniref:Uncharacterized protein n=2 Tax=Eucalyptus grandis TaxID=71139 RepID=A0ACC3J9D8_EUCGR|nr:hypothetical protein EUGRSUZ_J02475 [Eucalyptus grandis]